MAVKSLKWRGVVRTRGRRKGDCDVGRHAAMPGRYEHYMSWVKAYSANSWVLIMDTRDSFFQREPFQLPVLNRNEGVDLHLFQENRQVKWIGNCPFNSGWLGCWGRDVVKQHANGSVVCSGSTLGHRDAIIK
jgi:hypothetical protein